MFLANIDGSSEQQVGPKQSVCCPFVSRDGTRVAYTVSEADGIVSVVSDIGGGNPVTVEPPQGLRFGTGPFIPDDTRMVFEGFRDDMAFDHTYIADIDGANERVLTEEHFVPGDISPDGKTVLLFKTKESSSPRPGTLWLVDIDGTNLRQLTTTPLAQCCFNFRWSPDGSKIIFAAPEGGLWTVTPAGEALVEVVHVDGQWAITPTWSPDGSMLLFALDPSPDPFQHPANALYVTHADGSDLTKVVGGNDFKREPVWLRP